MIRLLRMKNLSYNVTLEFQKSLQVFESTRRDILLIPLTSKQETRFRFETIVDTILGGLALSGKTLNKKDITTILTTVPAKRMTALRQEVLNYRQTILTLRDQWRGSTKFISFHTLDTIALELYAQTDLIHIRKSLLGLNDSFQQLFDYIQGQKEHPIVQAAIAYMQSIAIAGNDFRTIALLLFDLLLWKHGYDMHGLFTLEPYWARDIKTFHSLEATTIQTGNYTQWLEYVAQSAVSHITQVKDSLDRPSHHSEFSVKLLELSDRQKLILSQLDLPDNTITNKKIQKLCSVSQITSSRDLSKLVTLGLIYPHGKGRSVYYTKS